MLLLFFRNKAEPESRTFTLAAQVLVSSVGTVATVEVSHLRSSRDIAAARVAVRAQLLTATLSGVAGRLPSQPLLSKKVVRNLTVRRTTDFVRFRLSRASPLLRERFLFADVMPVRVRRFTVAVLLAKG